MSFIISGGGILRCFSTCIDCSCMTPLASAMMVIRELTLHPADLSVCVCGLYLSHFAKMALWYQSGMW